MRTNTETLVKALRILAASIQSDDNVASLSLLETASRIEEIEKERESLKKEVARLAKELSKESHP